MPRKSSASLSVISSSGLPQRIAPPPGMSPDETRVFIDTVGSKQAGAFEPSDVGVLRAYCSSVVLVERAAAALQAEGAVIDNKPSPWLQVHVQAVRSMLASARRLRLAPLGRRSQERPGRVPSLSVYDQMDLERRQQGEINGYVAASPSWSRRS
jgi:Phage terminase, small subunit